MSYAKLFGLVTLAMVASLVSLAGQAAAIQTYDVSGYAFGTNVAVASSAAAQYSYTRSLWVSGDAVYVVWKEETGGTYSIRFAKSVNAGVTWSTPVYVSALDTLSKTAPALAVDGQGMINVVWQQYTGSTDGIYFARSSNGGQSFSTPAELQAEASGPKSTPRVDVDASGNIYVSYETAVSGDPDVWFVRSNDGGATWGSRIWVDQDTSADSGAQSPDIAVDGSGNVHVVWSRNVAPGATNERRVFHSRSTDGGATFSTPGRVNTASFFASFGLYPVVDTDQSGNLYVAWSGHGSGLLRDDVYCAASRDGGASFEPEVKVNDTVPDSEDQRYPSLRALGDGFVAVTWKDDRNLVNYGGVYVAVSADGGGTFTTNAPADDNLGANNWSFYEGPSLGVNTPGQVYVSFCRSDGGLQTYVVRGHPDNWTRVGSGPVFEPGPAGSWDDFSVSQPYVRHSGVNGQYMMLYCGVGSASPPQVGMASSNDGITWTRNPAPIIAAGNMPPYDSAKVNDPVLVLNPISTPGTYPYHEVWVTGTDGSGNGRGLYYIGDRTGWRLGHASPVLDVGAAGAWDSKVASPRAVIKDGGTYKMWYVGKDGTNLAVGYATSTNGINWTKYSGNPIFSGRAGTWEEAITNCRVRYAGGRYIMVYSAGRLPAVQQGIKLGTAVSSDGINWTRGAPTPPPWTQTDVPWFGPSGAGWQKRNIMHSFMLNDGNDYYMWYAADGEIDPGMGHTSIGLIKKTYSAADWPAASFTLNVPAGSTAADYTMHGLPVRLASEEAAAVLGPAVGQYSPVDQRIGLWDTSQGAYKEYPDFFLTPGAGCWFLCRNGLSHAFSGYKTIGSTWSGTFGLALYGVPLSYGWNMVANPYNHQVDVNGLIAFDSAADADFFYLLSPANTVTQTALWVWDGGVYTTASTLPGGGGAWVKCLRSTGNPVLLFPGTASAFPSQAADAAASFDLEQPPAPPGGLTSGGGGGGGGGCFVSILE